MKNKAINLGKFIPTLLMRSGRPAGKALGHKRMSYEEGEAI